jgi:hypothetical protein
MDKKRKTILLICAAIFIGAYSAEVGHRFR